MHIVTKAAKYQLSPETEALIEKKIAAPLRLLGDDREGVLLEIEVEEAPAEGRSSEPCRIVAQLSVGGDVFHAVAVKPTPESAADKIRSELEAEIRSSRGRTRRLIKRGRATLKRMLRFGR